jgi:hypothetical protein
VTRGVRPSHDGGTAEPGGADEIAAAHDALHAATDPSPPHDAAR